MLLLLGGVVRQTEWLGYVCIFPCVQLYRFKCLGATKVTKINYIAKGEVRFFNLHHELLYQSIPNSHTLLHHFSIDSVAVDGVVGEVGEGLGEGAEGGGCLGDGF